MSKPLNKMTVKALKALCKEMKLKKYSKLKKADLIALIQNNQTVEISIVRHPEPIIIEQVVEEIKEPTPEPVVVEEPLKSFNKPSLPARKRKTRKSLFPTVETIVEEPVIEEMKKEILEKLEVIEKQPEKRLTKQQEEVLANTVTDYDLLSDDEEEEEDYKNELEEIEMRMTIVDEMNLEEQKQKVDEKYQNKIKDGDVVEIEWADNVMEDLDEYVSEEYDEDITIPKTPKPKTPELKIDTTEPPLPSNLSMSPMTPTRPEIVEPELEAVVEEAVNYSKMKVKELKALCKSRGIKKYSKLKKAELIALLQ